jgi:hypothetical protein
MYLENQIVWLVCGKITCPDIADMWGSNIGAPEFNLLDHPDTPGSSADFPTKADAMLWVKEKGLSVIDMT